MIKLRYFSITTLAIILCFSGCESQQDKTTPGSIDELISQTTENEILATATELQDLVTRTIGYQGNVDAATYIYGRFAAMPGLSVVYQGGNVRNVVATLSGSDPASSRVYIVGAHYDSTSGTPAIAPGATDNACGVGIVLELARIMSKYRFRSTLKLFADLERGGNGEGQELSLPHRS